MFSAELVFRSLKLDEAALRTAKHILHLDASHGSSSVIAHGAKALFAELGKSRPDVQVEHVQLWDEAVRAKLDYNLDHVKSKMAMLSGSTSPEDVQRFAGIEALAAKAATARGLVVSVPMWNYGAPYVLKQYFDCILHPGLTFKETPSGPRGLLGTGRPLLVLTSSGGAAGRDHLTPWLFDVASMMGFDSPRVVSAPNIAGGDRDAALRSFAEGATAVAPHLAALSLREAAAGATQCQRRDDGEEEDAEMLEVDCGHEELLRWLRAQGGLSADALESLEAACVGGELFLAASQDDWQEEELGLEEADISRLTVLQGLFKAAAGAAG